MILTNACLHPMDAPVIPRGWLAFQGGNITGLGPMETCPAGEALDLQGAQVYPGLIDIHCHLGMFADALGFEGDDGNECTDPVTPHLRAIDSIDPLDRCFQEARAAGVTTVLTGPGSANPIGGQIAAIKTAGRWVDEMILRSPAAMKFALGENPKWTYKDRDEAPLTRMATAALIRESLYKAREYLRKQEKAAQDPETDGPDYDAKLEALAPVVQGKLPAHFHAHKAHDIATALRIGREFGLKTVIVHGTEAHQIAPLLAETATPVITGPLFGDRSKPELRCQRLENTALLSAAGVPTAICTDHPENPIQYLTFGAALAVQAGLDAERAMAAITLRAAEIAGIADRVGSLTPGKDADIAVFSACPLELGTKAERVFINGTLVSGIAIPGNLR